MATKHNKKITFEEAVSKLESIIESMEEGNTPLSDLVTFLEDGSTSGFDVEGGTFWAIGGKGQWLMSSS